MFYHVSPVAGIVRLEPRISNHEIPRIYFSTKRENVLVYLSNAVEKYCRQTGFSHDGPWYKWASYGFTPDGLLRLEEYYPNATEETYQGVSGYIYRVRKLPNGMELTDIPGAFVSQEPVLVESCEYIPDAYEAILRAAADGAIVWQRYADMAQRQREWVRKAIKQDYQTYLHHANHPDYLHFLRGKFPFLTEGVAT